MLVSKPCTHPECPQRQGYIRGYYESVEFIREIKAAKPLPKVESSADGTDETQANDAGEDDTEQSDTIVEWVMITRSDPGGSVPRFMIERGTPPGIANDAHKFWQWISSSDFEKLLEEDSQVTQAQTETMPSTTSASERPNPPTSPNSRSRENKQDKPDPVIAEKDDNELPGPGGVYGMVSGALGVVASAAASRLLGSGVENDTGSGSSDYISDASSSTHSFHSCDSIEEDDKEPSAQSGTVSKEPTPSVSTNGGDASLKSIRSTESSTPVSSHHEKELKKLEERRRKTEEKLQRAQERALAKRNDDAQRDELALQKLQEKHEREMAKQEEKYQRERRKLEAKRANEEKKAQEKRRKQAEREEKANFALELQKVRAERDVARKEIEILKEQVGQLQALNTKLVARLGREGVTLGDEEGGGGNGVGPDLVGSGPGNLRRAVTEKDMNRKITSVPS
jgi:hypothetical protein